MRVGDGAVIAFLESRQSAEEGRALVQAGSGRTWLRPRMVIVGREPDGSRDPIDVPVPAPAGAVVGAALGAMAGFAGGVEGFVVGFFFGLYVGILADGWRTLARGDLLDEIQDVLGPAEAALVCFARPSSTASFERRLASIGAATLRRTAGTPIEQDVAREVRDATADLRRLIRAADAQADGAAHRELTVAATRRLATLETVADRLLWIERLEFDSEITRLNRQLRRSSGWRAARTGARVARVRASHRRSTTMLETSRDRLGAAQALIDAHRVTGTCSPGASGRGIVTLPRVEVFPGARA